MHPIPRKRADTDMMILGPILSFNLPMKTPNRPETKKATADDPEMAARGQPNSARRGLKKTP
jgi:hypothetical protein